MPKRAYEATLTVRIAHVSGPALTPSDHDNTWFTGPDDCPSAAGGFTFEVCQGQPGPASVYRAEVVAAEVIA